MQPYYGINDDVAREKILKAMEAFKIAGVALDIGEDNKKLFKKVSNPGQEQLFDILNNDEKYDEFIKNNPVRKLGEVPKGDNLTFIHSPPTIKP